MTMNGFGFNCAIEQMCLHVIQNTEMFSFDFITRSCFMNVGVLVQKVHSVSSSLLRLITHPTL